MQLKFYLYVHKHPGLRIEQINKELGTTTKDLALPIKKLIAERKIAGTGDKRSRTYAAVHEVKPAPVQTPVKSAKKAKKAPKKSTKSKKASPAKKATKTKAKKPAKKQDAVAAKNRAAQMSPEVRAARGFVPATEPSLGDNIMQA